MEAVSKVMYTIANFFTWILAFLAITGIIFSSLRIAGIPINGVDIPVLGSGSLIYFVIVLIACLITIGMVRRAKDDYSSKGWDVFFLIVGILSSNIFYVLGGIFGLIAIRD